MKSIERRCHDTTALVSNDIGGTVVMIGWPLAVV
jgi:hypothetical protein